MVISRSVLDNGRSAFSRSARAAIKKRHPFVKRLAMLGWRSTLLLTTLVLAGGCTHDTRSSESQSMTPARATAVEEGGRAFTRPVPHAAPHPAPSACRRPFD